jgi:hypothetical protein
MTDKERRTREIAYFIWEREGRPEGQADRHWQEASRVVEHEDAARENVEGEPQEGERPAEYVTPLSTLTRGPNPGSR